MIGTRLRFGIGLMLAALAISSALGAEQKRGRSIEFSDAKGSDDVASTNQPTSKKDGLRQLEQELLQPFQNLAPKSSLDAVMPPLSRPRQGTQPVVPSKRTKEMRERMKNWIFMMPEDQIKGLTPEEIFDMPGYEADGQEKKKLSPIEKYYQQMGRRQDPRKAENGEKGDRLSSRRKGDLGDDPTDDSQDSDKEKTVDQIGRAHV